MSKPLIPHLIFSYQMSDKPIKLINERQSTLFTTKIFYEISSLENYILFWAKQWGGKPAEALCSSYLHHIFSLESILLVKSRTVHLASADWRATQPTLSRQNFMNCQFMSLFLHCWTPCSFEFKLHFWKRVHDLKISLTLLESADQKFLWQLVGKTILRKASCSPWGESCCRYDCFKCTAVADYLLIFLCKSLTRAQSGCMHLISASIKACTLVRWLTASSSKGYLLSEPWTAYK